MLYHLFTYLEESYDLPGAGLFDFISFRASMAVIISLLISLILGKRIIGLLRKMQVGETVRDLGLEGQMSKHSCQNRGLCCPCP